MNIPPSLYAMEIASEWVIRLTMLIYVPQRRSSAASRTWLLLIFLLPWPGLILYMLFGRIYVPRQRIAQQARASRLIREEQQKLPEGLVITPVLPPHLQHLPELVEALGDFEVFQGNRMEWMQDYQGSINRLVDDIEAATIHVHLETYILGTDAVAQKVMDALLRAAERGVTCRLFVDAVGGRRGVDRFHEELEKAGVEVVTMLPVGLFRRNAARFDLRNHRKIAVIDGKIAHIGSQNLVGPDFIPGFPNVELVARIKGPVVGQLQAVILADRSFEIHVPLLHDMHDSLFPKLPAAGNCPAQVFPSGPGFPRENVEEFFLSAFHSAQKSICVVTPYFVPDEPILLALTCAARRGVEVRLILSMQNNQKFTQLAQESHYEALLASGVHIHRYRPHFLHAKHITIDSAVGLVGSTNMDIRSFALNAEVSLVFYCRDTVQGLEAIEDGYLAKSEELHLAEWQQRPLLRRTAQNLARLGDSLL